MMRQAPASTRGLATGVSARPALQRSPATVVGGAALEAELLTAPRQARETIEACGIDRKINGGIGRARAAIDRHVCRRVGRRICGSHVTGNGSGRRTSDDKEDSGYQHQDA